MVSFLWDCEVWAGVWAPRNMRRASTIEEVRSGVHGSGVLVVTVDSGNADVPYKEYPAIKIARLAVDKKYERRGVGRFLLLVAVGKALKISDEVGCRFITVDSKQGSIGFYEKRGGFELVKKHKNRTYPTIYLDILPINEEMKAVNTELGDFQSPMN